MEEADLEMEIAKALLKDIRLMVSSEVDAKLDSFLKREQEEQHAARIKFLEQNVVWEDSDENEE